MVYGGVGTWPVIPAFIVVVGGTIAFGLVGAWLVQRYVSATILEQHNEVSGFILAVVGVVYAVLLGFAAIGVWEHFQSAETDTYLEAGNLTEIYRDADALPIRDSLRQSIRDYTTAIISSDFPAMHRGEQNTPTRVMIERIGLEIRQLKATSYSEQLIQQQMLEAFQAALDARDLRMSFSNTGLNGVMWFVLVAGALITIGYAFLFSYRHARMRTVEVGLLAGIIGLVIFLTMVMDYPFRGAVSVHPEAYEHAMQSYAQIDMTLPQPVDHN